MNIDERYLKILAKMTPYKTNKKYNILSSLGFAALIIGALMVFSANKSPEAPRIVGLTPTMVGIMVSVIGAAFIFIFSFLSNKLRIKAYDAFIKYYHEHQSLPPWPEEAKKPEKPLPPQKAL